MRKKRKYIIENTCVGMYLSDVHNEKIRIDQAVQRAFCSNNEFINNLVYSVVSNEIYIHNIILADENEDDKIIKSYAVDGGQRTVALGKFMYEGYRITKTIRESIWEITVQVREMEMMRLLRLNLIKSNQTMRLLL